MRGQHEPNPITIIALGLSPTGIAFVRGWAGKGWSRHIGVFAYTPLYVTTVRGTGKVLASTHQAWTPTDKESKYKYHHSRSIILPGLLDLFPSHTHLYILTNSVKMVPSIKLNSGAEMPQVGFGLWKVDGEIASDVVYNAIKAGYRLFDGACGTFKPSFHLPIHIVQYPIVNSMSPFSHGRSRGFSFFPKGQ